MNKNNNEHKMTDIGQIWPHLLDVLIPFADDYKIGVKRLLMK